MAAWQQSLEELVRNRGGALVGYAFLLCGERRAAEDLVQDALVRTFARSRVAAAPDNLEGYVRRAVLSAYLDGFRRRRRWAAVQHLVTSEPQTRGPEDAATASVDVRAALAQLSPRERACVVLRFYEDLALTRIADELALSEGAVKRYLSDGIRRMEALLGPLALRRDGETTEVHYLPAGRRPR